MADIQAEELYQDWVTAARRAHDAEAALLESKTATEKAVARAERAETIASNGEKVAAALTLELLSTQTTLGRVRALYEQALQYEPCSEDLDLFLSDLSVLIEDVTLEGEATP